MHTDKEIVEKILSGNTDLYRELVLRYQQKVFSVTLKMTKNPIDAEDLAQEVFIQVYKSLPSFKFNSEFSTWIYKITVNKCLDWKRKFKNQLSEIKLCEELKNCESKTLLPEELLLQKANKHNINLMLNRLPEAYRYVIILYYYNNLSYQEIAIKLQISKKTVESRLYRGKNLLRKILKEEGLEWIVK